MSSPSLCDRAVLVDLTVTQWTASVFDKRVTADVAIRNGSRQDMGSFHKRLVLKATLDPINAAVNALRAEHYRRSLPWCDSGPRVLNSRGYLEYAESMRKLQDAYWEAVHLFWDAYPGYVQDAKVMLNGLFDPKNYPSLEAVKARYRCTVSVLPISADFRTGDAGSDAAEAARIKAEMDQAVRVALSQSIGEIWTRFRECISRVQERLAAYNDRQANEVKGNAGVFRDTLVENLRDLVDLVPSLNVVGDPAIDAFAARVKSELCAFDPETLRTSGLARNQTAAAADAILKAMEDYL